MKTSLLCGAAASLITLSMTAPAAAAPASGPSNYIKCDGRPNNVTTGETAARLLGAVTLLGLFAPPPESASPSQRLSGQEGIAACDTLLVSGDAGEGNVVRRIQLHQARAIHRIEAKNYPGAIEDLRALEAGQAAYVATDDYKYGLGLSTGYIEALALAAMGKTQDAADKALTLGETVPYDLQGNLRIGGLVNLSDRYGSREQAYHDRLVRMMPLTLLSRADARLKVRDYRGAAQDYDQLVSLLGSYNEAQNNPIGIAATSALYWYLAGDKAMAATRESEARNFVDKQSAAGKSPTQQIELLDFLNIAKLIDQGDLRQARLLFAGRTKWSAPSPYIQADIAERLRKDAKPDDLIGLLAKAPADFPAEAKATRLSLLNAAGEKGERRFSAMAPVVTRAAFDKYAVQLWKPGNSRYFAKKINEKSDSWTVNTLRDGGGVEGGYALMLATALEAKKRGHSHFAFSPYRLSPNLAQVRMGDNANAQVPAAIAFSTDQVIADLRPLFPMPARK